MAATHIWQSKRITPQIHLRLWEMFKRKRPGYYRPQGANHIQQLIYILERWRMGGTSDPGIDARRRGARVTDKIAEKTFERLLLKPAKVPSLKEWSSLTRPQLQRRLLGPVQRNRVKKLASIYTGVFNLHRSTAEGIAIRAVYSNKEQHFFKTWLKFKRGRDFFIKGMGTFDLTGSWVIRSLSEQLVTPYGIMAVGYVGKVTRQSSSGELHHLAKMLEHHPQYVARWWTQLLEVLDQTDEVGWELNLDTNEGNLEISPQQHIANHQEIYGRAEYNDEVEPVPLTHEYKIAMKMPIHQTPMGLLAPVLTFGELQDVGKSLHNCAGGYHSRCDNGGTVLVTLIGKERYQALGELSMKDRMWLQILGPCNQRVSDDVRKAYNSYLRLNLPA